jgi:hypothetical protein
MRSFKLLAIGAFLSACSSTATTDGGTDGGGTDGSKPDAKTEGGADGGSCGTLADISGMIDMAIHVQEFNFGMAMPADLAGASVRVEQATMGNCGGYLDGTTDAMGVAHIKVDMSKGPFDVTAALANYSAISVLNLAGPLATPIITNKTNTGSAGIANHSATGAITGKIAAGDQVQIDAPYWATVATTAATYMNTFETVTMGMSPPLVVTGVEVDGTGTVNNAVFVKYMGTGSRPNANITGFDIAFPGNSTGFATANITVNWPAAGVLKASDVAGIGSPVQDMHLGKGAVVVQHFTNPDADMFVGVADTAKPAGMTSTIKIQAATSGPMQPTYWEASYYTGMGGAGDTFIRIHSSKLNNNDMFTVGTINMLDAMGTNLDDFTFAADSNGYDAVRYGMFAQDAMGATYAAWLVYSAGSKITTHHIPHLPKAVKFADISGGALSGSEADVLSYEGGSTAPWSETTKPANVIVAKDVGTIDQGSRP